ncbi:MAG: N-acetylglucosamine-6-phosphate deacetylase [Lentisphaerae bacterium GWF2_45_14]|nr:MAG: N-acetylglucosamine-6-phosphate deacetylase [Lentisphaerae bacterium GWF2_45_14]
MKEKRRLYIADYCFTPYESISRCGILCSGERIIAIGGASAFVKESKVEIIDVSGAYAVPGFIDSHIHGCGGFDSSTAHRSDTDIGVMCRVLSTHGVTSFLPTVISAPVSEMLAALDALSSMMEKDFPGAQPVGIHLEGPFLSRAKHGSQREDDILSRADTVLADELIAAAKGKIKIFTLAPELPGSLDLIEFLLEKGITPSMGHSLADETQVLMAVDAGARRCTHIYNGMPPLHHREVSLTAIALTDDRITIEIIVDGRHIHPTMIELACRIKPKDKIIGVSDAIQGAGLNDGTYQLGASQVNVEKGVVTTPDGTMAGTTMTLEQSWEQLVSYSLFENMEAAACFTSNPAKSLGLEDRGELRPGKRADIAFFEGGTNKNILTVAKGKIVFDINGKLNDIPELT